MEASYSINFFDVLPNTIWSDIYNRKRRYRNVEELYNLNSDTRETLLYMIKFDRLKLFHGIVYNSGHVEIGTLEDGSTEFLKVGTPIPIDAANMDGKSVIQVSAGGEHSLFLCEDGSAYSSGVGYFGQLGDGRDDNHNEGTPIPIDTDNMGDKRVIQVSAGHQHSLFLCEDGSVFASGYGTAGILGDGRSYNHKESTPIPIDTSNMQYKRVIQVSAGRNHSLFLCEDGTVYASGEGQSGQLGDGRTDRHDEGTPIPIDTANMQDKRVIQVSAGYVNSLFLCEDGSVYASGSGIFGQLGDGRIDDHDEGTPIQIDTANMDRKRVIQISAGLYHSLFLCEDGSVYACGNGEYGVLGDGRTYEHYEGTPIPIDRSNMKEKRETGLTCHPVSQRETGLTCHPVSQRVIQVAAGYQHSLFLCEDGTVYSSGDGEHGQLGDGRTDDHDEGIPIPIDTSNMNGKRVIQVSANEEHSLFLT